MKLPNIGSWLINNGFTSIFMFFFVGLNVFVFLWFYMIYALDDQFFYTRHILGVALSIARGSAGVLNFDCMLILLPMCRNLLSWARGSIVLRCGRRVREQLDKSIVFHKLVAYTIAFWTTVHIVAHLFNAEFLNDSRRGFLDPLNTALSALNDDGNINTTYINPVRLNTGDPTDGVTLFVMATLTGLTGVVGTLALILMITSSTDYMRRNYFELFWYTHHLFVAFFIAIVAHGAMFMIRGSNTNALPFHNHTLCKDRVEEWGLIPECPIPQFRGGFLPETWRWVAIPMFLYFFERMLRFYRSTQPVEYRKIVMHQSRVLELRLVKDGFKMDVGQYVFLNCPDISMLEWHPFTMTSAPEDDFLSIHMRDAGDWTEKLICRMEELPEGAQGPKIRVDGPYGTASEDVFDYEVSMLVGAGIGVTPFASILRSIYHKYKASDPKLRTKKIYFYWLCRETNAFEWFADLLAALEKDMEARGMADFLTYKLHLTAWDQSHTDHVMVRFDADTDVVTGLKSKIYYGRPNWDKEFEQVRKDHPKSVVGIFVCGPEALTDVLESKCLKYTDIDSEKTKFYFNKENF